MRRQFILALFLSYAAGAVGQQKISGVITDPEGAVVPHAQVSVTDASRRQGTSANANGTGFYEIDNLVPGKYSLSFVAPGFASRSEEVVLHPNEQRGLNVTLKIDDHGYPSRCPRVPVSVPWKQRPAQFTVELERATCFGTCPAYSLEINSDGEGSYDGKEFVLLKGHRTFEIPNDALASFAQKYLSVEFFNLCDDYDIRWTDSPTTYVTVSAGSLSKRVRDYGNGGPEFLERMELAIDDLADSHQWRHGTNESLLNADIEEDGYGQKRGVTPLMRAAVSHDIKTLREALEGTRVIDTADESGWTALMYAAATGNFKAAKELIQAGANVNARSKLGETPLMAAAAHCEYTEPSIVGLLLESGADVNEGSDNGETALMFAAWQYQIKCVPQLIKKGAKVNARSTNGKTALSGIKREGDRGAELYDYLVKAGAGS